MNHIKSRLSSWKSKYLSFDGRLVLLKTVLTSLPVYALSFFKALSSIISLIESIFKKINWVGVRITGKFPGLFGALFVLKRSVEGWGLGS